MDIINSLTQTELDTLNYLRRNSEDSATLENFINPSSWLTYWAKAKTDFFHQFGEKLILTKEVEAVIDSDTLLDSMYNLVRDSRTIYLRDRMITKIEELNLRADDFVWGETNERLTSIFRYYVFTKEAFMANSYTGPSVTFAVAKDISYELKTGCKLMRALGRIAKAFNLTDIFEEVRLEQSRIMNEANLRATLCVSIHPLDFLTASLNNNGWRSCMEWWNGEYRRGVIEMMNSPCVITAYIASEHETLDLTSSLSWNSKKWREFFIVTPEAIMGIKGYPYWNTELEKETLIFLKEIFDPTNSIYFNHIQTIKNIFDFNIPNLNITNLHFDISCGPAMYNDFNSDGTHQMFISKKFENTSDKTYFLDYSGESQCAICGSTSTDFETEGNVGCCECLETYKCCKCGSYITDESYLVNDQMYCCDCYENLPRCSYCEESFDPEEDPETGIEFGIINNKKQVKCYSFSGPEIVCCCANCADKVFTEGETAITEPSKFVYSSWRYELPLINLSELTSYGLDFLNQNTVFEDSKYITERGI